MDTIELETGKELDYYPTPEEIDAWADMVWKEIKGIEVKAEILNEVGYQEAIGVRHHKNNTYVKFCAEGFDDFYGYWQPTRSTPAPLLIHVPGYGAEVSSHPEFVNEGYNVLHISPLGYATPAGLDLSKQKDDQWPVLPDTVYTNGKEGYKKWLQNCILATEWAQQLPEVLPDRLSFFGTSQGGAGALFLASLYKDKGVRCVGADVAFLTNFPLSMKLCPEGAYSLAKLGMDKLKDKSKGWKILGTYDTLSHVHRLPIPILLTAGDLDEVCPYQSIESLFAKLIGTKCYHKIEGREHDYTPEFTALFSGWLKLYA